MGLLLATLADWKEFYGIPTQADVTKDAQATRFLTIASDQIHRMLGRQVEKPASGDYTEVYELDMTEKIVWPVAVPIGSVTTAKYARITNDWSNVSELVEDSDYVIDERSATEPNAHPNHVRMLFETPYRPGYVQLVYSGGLVTNGASAEIKSAHPDLNAACILQANYMMERKSSPGGSASFSGGSKSYVGQYQLLDAVDELISPYILHQRSI